MPLRGTPASRGRAGEHALCLPAHPSHHPGQASPVMPAHICSRDTRHSLHKRASHALDNVASSGTMMTSCCGNAPVAGRSHCGSKGEKLEPPENSHQPSRPCLTVCPAHAGGTGSAPPACQGAQNSFQFFSRDRSDVQHETQCDSPVCSVLQRLANLCKKNLATVTRGYGFLQT